MKTQWLESFSASCLSENYLLLATQPYFT